MVVSKHDKKAVMQCVADAITYGMSDAEAMEYIETRTGATISDRTLWRYKQFVQNDETTNQWLKHFSRVGFVMAIRTRIEEMRRLQADTWRFYLHETAKGPDRMNPGLVMRYQERLESQNKRLTELELATPIVAEIKQLIDRGSTTVTESDDPALADYPV